MSTLARAASIGDLRRLARARLPRMVFDYIDGASGDEATARRNRAGFERYLLEPEILVDLSRRSLATTLFGQASALPIVIGPTGMNGAYWPQGDLCLARAAKAAGIPFVMSTAATVELEPLVAAAGPMRWFQLYMLNDRGLARTLLERVHASGFEVLQLTVDTAVSGRRNRDIRNGFTLPFRWTPRTFLDAASHPRWALAMLASGPPSLKLFAQFVGEVPRGATITDVMQRQISNSFTWHDLGWLREHWPGKLVLKGIANARQAEQALGLGVDGAVVSNHGGRQLDGAASTIEQLPRIADAVGGRMTLLIDSGIRCGADIAKAIALGADAVQLGRATLYGLAAGGEAGARQALAMLAEELDRAMGLCGATAVGGLRGRATAASTP